MYKVELIDSHAHLTSPELLPDLVGVLQRANDAGVCNIVNICTDGHSLEAGLKLHQEHPWVYTAAAVTPHDAADASDLFFPAVERAARGKQLIAIGETGLDYYYKPETAEAQKHSLRLHFALAKELKLPVIFHCRDAFADLFALADVHYAHLPAVLHCFTGTLEEAKEVLARGWMLSLSGIVTFNNAQSLREVAKAVPLEQLLIETDAPYLAPKTKRGKRNESAYIVETAECIAEQKGVEVDVVARHTKHNAEKIFAFHVT